MVKLYNTLTGAKERLPSPADKKTPIRLFVCGPTVYDYPHIGNARTFMVFDIIARYLRSRGAKLFYLQNITDIDDKIIARAKEDGVDWKTTSRRFEKIFLADMKRLGITSVDKYARATDYIPQIVSQVTRLKASGHAYLIEGDGYYFDLKKFPEYGKLARRTIEQAEDGVSRIDESDKKRNKGDFALWKFSHEGEPGWKTELGFGRPGWHIEDTAITEKFFGLHYELHGGALDLKFPHHEAEIAQAESLSAGQAELSGNAPFVNVWMHAGFLFVNGKKMSKSLGNFITIDDFASRNASNIFRWMVLAHHYRSPMDYTKELLAQSKGSFSKVHQFVGRLALAARQNTASTSNVDMPAKVSESRRQFEEAMDDDFNTPDALGRLFGLIFEFQNTIWELSREDAKTLAEYLESVLKALGIALKSPKIPSEIKALVKKREACRVGKQFIQSDALRKEIYALGYIVEDTPMGPFVWPK